MKTVRRIVDAPSPHWVGDGFHVRSLFGYNDLGQELSPFLLLDYGAPRRFEPASTPRGVGVHPHRGFETVTLVYQGEVDHRDSTGAGGRIGPGDVQWMTAAGGILHEEFHSPAFTRSGGTFEVAQLWVNLPAAHKRAAPGYQGLCAADIPVVALPDGAGQVRVIAGAFAGQRGPARTFTPIDVWDVRLAAGARVHLPQPDGHTLALAVLNGDVRVNGDAVAQAGQLVVCDRAGDGIDLETAGGATVLLLGGEPIDEPIVGYGPFVMNTREEIREAIEDFNAGRFGAIA